MSPFTLLFAALALLLRQLLGRKQRESLEKEREQQARMYEAINELRSARDDESLEIALQRAQQASLLLDSQVRTLRSLPEGSRELRQRIEEIKKLAEETLRFGMEAQAGKRHVMVLANKAARLATIYPARGYPRFLPEGAEHEDEALRIFDEIDSRNEDREAFESVDTAEHFIRLIL